MNALRKRSVWCGAVLAIVTLAGIVLARRFDGETAKADETKTARRSTPSLPPAKPPPPEMSVETNGRRALRQPAHLEPYEQTDIIAKASGFIAKLHIDIGDLVSKDQLLAELWIPEMNESIAAQEATVEESEATVQQATASIEAARAMLNAATAKLEEARAAVLQYEAKVDFHRSERDRFARIVRDSALNKSVLDEKKHQYRAAESELAVAQAAVVSAEAGIEVERARIAQADSNRRHAEARLKVAEAELKRLKVLMSYAEIRAPFEGTITARNVDTGAFIASGADGPSTPLFALTTVDRLRIVVDVPEPEAPLVAVGQTGVLTVNGVPGKEYPVTVKRTEGVLDARAHALRIEAELTEPARELRPGMYGLLEIVLSAPTR